MPATYLHLNGHQAHGLDQHFLGLMAYDKRAGARHLVVDITVVVVNVDPKVVHRGVNLLHQHVGAVTLVTVVEPIEGDEVWIPPASAVACGKSSANRYHQANTNGIKSSSGFKESLGKLAVIKGVLKKQLKTWSLL